MLVLTRKIGESIRINDDIKLTIVEVKGKNIRIGIEAPRETKIYREELFWKIRKENEAAASARAFDLGKVAQLLQEKLKKG
ncbi:MAG: carbon storage regulator CsrA [Nitrospinales bacterium]